MSIKLRDPNWSQIRRHDVIPDKREEMKKAADKQEMCATNCPRCHAVLRTMFVHGHEQCTVCHAIVEDCCQGAPL